MTRRRTVLRAISHGDADYWKGQYESILDVMNAVLLAYGEGPQHRLAVSNRYYLNQKRRELAMEALGDRFVLYLEPKGPVQ